MRPDSWTHVFIVRVWDEPRELRGAGRIQRAFIRHVNSGVERYVRDPSEILSFIRTSMDAPQDPPPGKWSTWWRNRRP